MEAWKDQSINSYERALCALDVENVGPNPDAPSCHQYRLRPSEEAAIILNKFLNPPPPWGMKVDLSKSFLGPEKCMELGRKLILNKTLTYLDLGMCDMQEAAAVVFFNCLSKNSTLKFLSVNGNYINDIGAIAASKCLCTLEALHIASNNISDIGAEALADSLRRSSTIKTLNIRNNNITEYGLFKFMDALEPALELVPESVQEIVRRKDRNEMTLDKSTIESLMGGGTIASNMEEPYSPVEVEPKESRGTQIESELAAVSVQDPDHDEENAESVEEIPYNETLHTLWTQSNHNVPEEMLKNLAKILAKRFPQPPPGAEKKKKRKKKKS